MASNDKRTLNLDALDTNRLRKSMEQAGLLGDGLKKHAEVARKLAQFAVQQINIPTLSPALTEFVKTTAALNDRWRTMLLSPKAFDFSRVFSAFDWLIEEGRKAKLVDNTSWLQHHTTPFDLLNEDASQDEAVQVVANYYRDHWDEVERAFIEQLERYDVDDEAKTTLKEALAAHRQGLFRVGPRLLFPEIERVCSEEFFDGKHMVPVTTPKGKKTTLPITRLKEVRGMMLRLPAGHLKAYAYSWQLFKKVESHLYEDVDETQESEVQRYRTDPVPNRHAALHGIVSYNTQQTSLNAIIMADFIFHMVSQLKKYMAAIEEEEEAEQAV